MRDFDVRLFSCPYDYEEIKKTIDYLHKLINNLNSEIEGVSFNVNFIDARKESPDFDELHQRYFEIFFELDKGIEIRSLVSIYNLLKFDRIVEEDMKRIEKKTSRKMFDKLSPLIDSALEKRDEFKNFITASFVRINKTGAKIEGDDGYLGLNCGSFPFGVSIELSGERELIFHEFLHLFGVEDGYNQNGNYDSCIKCWMQYNPMGKATLLCEYHKGQLEEFLNKYKTK